MQPGLHKIQKNSKYTRMIRPHHQQQLEDVGRLSLVCWYWEKGTRLCFSVHTWQATYSWTAVIPVGGFRIFTVYIMVSPFNVYSSFQGARIKRGWTSGIRKCQEQYFSFQQHKRERAEALTYTTFIERWKQSSHTPGNILKKQVIVTALTNVLIYYYYYY